MNKKNKHINPEDDVLLHQWLNGELTGEALDQFINNPAYQEYIDISETTHRIHRPTVDQAQLFTKIQGQIASQKHKAKTTPLWIKLSSIAALLIICVAVTSLMLSQVKVDSMDAIQVSHVLPDGSQVILNSDSKMQYAKRFEDRRSLSLRGEAFFEVERGSTFTVETEEGNIMVIGTSFNVYCRDGVLSVACKTGQISVQTDDHVYTLSPGERVRIDQGNLSYKEQVALPTIGAWAEGESQFDRVPIQDVVSALCHKYRFTAELPARYHDQLYTGAFVHHDLEKALKMVLLPMGIPYDIKTSGQVVIR